MYLDKRKNEIYTFAGALFELRLKNETPKLIRHYCPPTNMLGLAVSLSRCFVFGWYLIFWGYEFGLN